MRREYVFLETRTENLGNRPVAYVDTTGNGHDHAGPWMHLSHWYPNETPAAYRADTSTEIALRFAAKNPDHDLLPVNDHCDTDGVLSIFALVHPDVAAEHYDAVVGAAELGDFSFWPERGARRLYAALADVRQQTFESQAARFAACLDVVEAVLTGTAPLSAAALSAVDVLDVSAGMVELATRTEVGPRFVAYVTDRAQLDAPRFDALPTVAWLSHAARNQLDRERLQLLSVPSTAGWHHSLWYPQYLPWDTDTLWRMPGIEFTGDNLTWRCVDDGIVATVADLAAREPDAGWSLAGAMAPFAPGFPVLVHGNDSALAPDELVPILGAVLPS